MIISLHGNIPQLLGPTLRRMRKEHGWTLQEVATRADCSVSFVSEVERGVTNPALAMVMDLCAALGYRVGLELERCKP